MRRHLEEDRRLLRHHPVVRLKSGMVYLSRSHDTRSALRRPEIVSCQRGLRADVIEPPLGDTVDAIVGQEAGP
jgi:hypothetical protein